MLALAATGVSTVMLIGVLGGWNLTLRSVCASSNWQKEVKDGTQRLKGKTSFPSFPRKTSCQSSLTHWRFTGKFVKNQKGSVELMGLMLLVAMTAAVALLISVWEHRHRQVEEHLRQTLCLKTAMLETNQLVTRINKLNAAILAGEVTSWGLVLLGGFGVALKPSWEQAKKAMQIAQEAQWLLSHKEFLKMKNSGCKLPLALWAGPYKWQGRLKRSVDGRALMRTQDSLWVMTTPLSVHWARWKVPHGQSWKIQWELR